VFPVKYELDYYILFRRISWVRRLNTILCRNIGPIITSRLHKIVTEICSVRFQILTAATIKSTYITFWDGMPCSLV
jgi:hypothetical protein